MQKEHWGTQKLNTPSPSVSWRLCFSMWLFTGITRPLPPPRFWSNGSEVWLRLLGISLNVKAKSSNPVSFLIQLWSVLPKKCSSCPKAIQEPETSFSRFQMQTPRLSVCHSLSQAAHTGQVSTFKGKRFLPMSLYEMTWCHRDVTEIVLSHSNHTHQQNQVLRPWHQIPL